jgi:hypothetical protein
MDAINRLAGATRGYEATADVAAQQIATADLPLAATGPDPSNPVAPQPPGKPEVDVAGQLVTMQVAVDMQHVTTAALRSAFSLYRDSLDLIRPEHPADS